MSRLLICSSSYAIHGGVETIVNDLCRELPSRGWDVVLGLGRGRRFNDPERYRAAHGELPIVEIDGRGGTRQSRLEALTATIRRVQPDVVLSTRVFDAYEAVAEEKLRTGKPRLAVAIRSYEAQYLSDARRFRDSTDLFVVDGRLLAAACDAFCAIPNDRIANIPGGVRAPAVAVAPRSARSPIRLGYVGRLEQRQKRVMDLVPFVQGLDDSGVRYTLDVVGSGPQSHELEHALADWISRGTVVMRGWLATEQLYADVLPGLDSLVHFSPSEGVAMAPREAMAHGVVPLLSEFLGLHSEGVFIPEVNALTFPVADIAAAVRQVRRLIEQEGLLSRLSQRGMQSPGTAYSYDGSIDAWARALDQVMARPPILSRAPKIPRSDHGRLARLGVPPRMAQRMRDLLGRYPAYSDAGSEWPTSSGMTTAWDAATVQQFAIDHESRCRESVYA